MNSSLCVFFCCSFRWHLNWQLKIMKNQRGFLVTGVPLTLGTQLSWLTGRWTTAELILVSHLCSVLWQQPFRRWSQALTHKVHLHSDNPQRAIKSLIQKYPSQYLETKGKSVFKRWGTFVFLVFFLVGGWGVVTRYNTEKQGNISEPHFLLLIYCKRSSAQRAEYSQKLN